MKYNILFTLTLIIFLTLLTNGCQKEHKIRIAVTKASGSENYKKYALWIHNSDQNVEIIDLYKLSKNDALKAMDSCDGLILSGGPDIDPAKYGKAFDSALCKIDFQRDSMEFEIINLAKIKKIPILGVCRGLQILNVAEGGTLITDIPLYIKSNVSHQQDSGDATHKIRIIENTYLNKLTHLTDGLVNSNHHQAVDKLADNLLPTAFSEDGIIEAFEYKDKNKPFMMAIQWHPERLDYSNPLSKNIVNEFIKQIKLNKKSL